MTATLPPPVRLTPRRAEVWALMCDGLELPEIAARLCLSLKTVEAHKAAIRETLGHHGGHGWLRAAYAAGQRAGSGEPCPPLTRPSPWSAGAKSRTTASRARRRPSERAVIDSRAGDGTGASNARRDSMHRRRGAGSILYRILSPEAAALAVHLQTMELRMQTLGIDVNAVYERALRLATASAMTLSAAVDQAYLEALQSQTEAQP